jgi:hypothetical protein
MLRKLRRDIIWHIGNLEPNPQPENDMRSVLVLVMTHLHQLDFEIPELVDVAPEHVT